MSDQDEPINGNLVPAGRRDVAPVPAANPLVSRGIADLAELRVVTAEGDRPPDPEALSNNVDLLPQNDENATAPLFGGYDELLTRAKLKISMLRANQIRLWVYQAKLPDEDPTNRDPFDPSIRLSHRAAACLRHVLHLLEKMDKCEAMVLRMSFGLGEEEPKTLDEIGERLGLPSERVSEIYGEGLANLSESMRVALDYQRSQRLLKLALRIKELGGPAQGRPRSGICPCRRRCGQW